MGQHASPRSSHVHGVSQVPRAHAEAMENKALLSTSRTVGESLDGAGSGDHDAPYTFGRRPRGTAPYPFSTRQYMRLLVLRSRIGADLVGLDDRGAA